MRGRLSAGSIGHHNWDGANQHSNSGHPSTRQKAAIYMDILIAATSNSSAAEHHRRQMWLPGQTHQKNQPRLTKVPPVANIQSGNEAADEWAKLAASEPDDHGVECRRHPAACTTDIPSAPAAQGVGKERGNLDKGYVLRKKGKPDPTPTRAEKRTASRFYRLKSGHALTGVHLKSTDNRPDDHC